MSDPPIVIRRLGVADAEAYRAIRLATLELAPASFGALYADEVRRPLEHFAAALGGAAIFGADREGRLVGTARLQPGAGAKERHKGSINGVFVHPAHRGSGLGRALLLALIDAARPTFEHLTLTVVAGNAAAIALYESLGFRRYGLEPRARKFEGAYTDILLMLLPLSPPPSGTGPE